MSLLDRSRSAETPAERAVRLWVESADAHGIDPLFRRRLRGSILNRYVAAREAPARSAQAARRTRSVARACLYGTVALGLSVGGAMAASTAAIPGDVLYPVKRQIEEVRTALLPAQFRDELAAHEFAQRVNELGRLLEAGDHARAASLMPDVQAAHERLLLLRAQAGRDGLVGAQVAILESLLDRLPPQAADAIERALERAPGVNRTVGPGPASEGGPPAREPRNAPQGPQKGAPAVGNGPPKDTPGASETQSNPKPDREPRGRPSPAPSPPPSPAGDATPLEPDDQGD